MSRHISNWKWLDKHLCFLLFSKTSPTVKEKLLPAIEYYMGKKQTLQENLVNLSPSPPRQFTKCCLIFNAHMLHTSELYKRIYYRAILSTMQLDEPLSRAPYLIDAIDIINPIYTNHVNRRDGRIYYSDLGGRKFKGDILDYDFYVYLMDPEFHSRHQLLHLLSALKPHQKLIIAVLPGGWNNEINDMDVFAKFVAGFNNFVGCPLATTEVDWRLCCVERLSVEDHRQ
eukprot:TsM_001005100 transcript=TsM_001005100 gene=TsM_001005100